MAFDPKVITFVNSQGKTCLDVRRVLDIIEEDFNSFEQEAAATYCLKPIHETQEIVIRDEFAVTWNQLNQHRPSIVNGVLITVLGGIENVSF
jgi:hypothetical protein